MPEKLSGFLTRLAKAAGLPETNANLIAINEALKANDPEIDPVFENMIHSNLLSLEAAKNNTVLNRHFEDVHKARLWAQALGPMDDHIYDTAKALEFDDIDSLKAEKDTRKKLSTLVEKLKDSYEKKGKSSTEKAQIEQERKDLHQKIKDLEQKVEAVRVEEQGKVATELRDINLNALLASYTYGLPKEIPQEVVFETAKNLVLRKLNENKFKVEYQPEKKSLGLFNETGQIPYQNNTPVMFKEFVDKVLAEGNLLQVSGTPTPSKNGSGEQQKQTQQSGPDNSAINEMMASQLAAFK